MQSNKILYVSFLVRLLPITLFIVFVTCEPDPTDSEYCRSDFNSTQSVIKYDVARVQDEYIVQFRGYYNTETRKLYITSALAARNISYTVLPRTNPMSVYPNDFDIISGDLNESVLCRLRQHPLIKSVTPQRRVTRSLLEAPSEPGPC